MSRELSREDFERLVALLTSPDGDDLKGRGHTTMTATVPKQLRRRDVLPPIHAAYWHWRHQQADPEPYIGRARIGRKFTVIARRA